MAIWEKAVAAEDYEHAALLQDARQPTKEKIEELSSKQTEAGWSVVKLNDVAATVSKMTGVPLEQLKRSEVAKLTGLERI